MNFVITPEAYRRVARREMFPKGAKVGVNDWHEGQHVLGSSGTGKSTLATSELR